jgi:hypothetical protein
MIWYDMIWYDMIWYDMVWYDMIWYDMIWYDMIWYMIYMIYDMMIWYMIYDMYDMIRYAMMYLLTAIGLSSGGISTVHIYIQTIHRTTQNKQYAEQHKNFERVRAVPRLCDVYPGIFLTTEEKARRNLSHGRKPQYMRQAFCIYIRIKHNGMSVKTSLLIKKKFSF